MDIIVDDNDDKLIREGAKDIVNFINNVRLLKNSIVKEKRYKDAAWLREIERELWRDVHTAIRTAWIKVQKVEWPEDAEQFLTSEEDYRLYEETYYDTDPTPEEEE